MMCERVLSGYLVGILAFEIEDVWKKVSEVEDV